MKILSPQQLYLADKNTIKRQGITSWELMERASLLATHEILELIDTTKKIYILAGTGNNGGDGLAIAYHLCTKGFDVEVHILKYAHNYSDDCAKNLKRLENKTDVKINILKDASYSFVSQSVFIDAIFGIGLTRKLPDFVEHTILKINKTKGLKIAIDVPSGLYLSDVTPRNSVVFKADFTLSFQCPKLNFFLPDYGNYVGKLKVIDIGLDQQTIDECTSYHTFLTENLIKQLVIPRQRFSHKGTFGHLLIVGGQKGMMGCMVLASKAALKSGAGKVTALAPHCGTNILQIACPETMVLPSFHEDFVSPHELNFSPETICIGMGIGTGKEALETLSDVLNRFKSPMVIDADAINIMAKHKVLLDLMPSKSILTPHQGELKRLLGSWDNEYDKIEKLKSFSKQYDCIIVSKDAYTTVVHGDELYINSTGNAGMATAGSGDVLSGLISGFVAQGYLPINAALVGVFLHGLSGDMYASKFDQNSLIASDIIENFKEAFSLLKK